MGKIILFDVKEIGEYVPGLVMMMPFRATLDSKIRRDYEGVNIGGYSFSFDLTGIKLPESCKVLLEYLEREDEALKELKVYGSINIENTDYAITNHEILDNNQNNFPE